MNINILEKDNFIMHRYVRRNERDSRKRNLVELFLVSCGSIAADLRTRRQILACDMSNIASYVVGTR